MSIEIDILNGKASWPKAEPLLNAVWPHEAVRNCTWQGISAADADLRVLVEDELEGIVCHIGIYLREGTWNGRRIQIGGIGAVATREDRRCQGYASIALNAAIQTLKDEGATDLALLFCRPPVAPFYAARGWRPFDGEILAEQSGKRGRFDAIAAHIFPIRRTLLKGTVDLCGLPW